MTRDAEPRLHVGMLTEAHPAVAETFVARQAAWLGSPVACAIAPADAPAPEGAPPVTSLTGGTPIRGGQGPRVLRRAWARLFGEPAPYWSRAAEAAFRAWLEAGRFDVLLAQFGPNGIRAHAACADLGVPLVVQFFGQDASALLRQRRYVGALPPLFAYASAVVVMSTDMGARLVACGCPPEKIRVIPVGVPTKRLVASRGVATQPCRFLAAHRWVPKKGTLEMLRAFVRCRTEVPGVSLDLVGDGPLASEVRRLVRRERLQDSVRLHGSVPNAVLRERFLEQAGCLVQHSRTAPNGDREGWPVIIAEAAAASLPVIATRHAAIPEQVLHGESGLLVEEGDVSAMAEHMVRLARNPDAREHMGRVGRRHIAAVGDLDTQLGQLSAVLREARRE